MGEKPSENEDVGAQGGTASGGSARPVEAAPAEQSGVGGPIDQMMEQQKQQEGDDQQMAKEP